MVIVDVKMLSGFIPVKSSVKKLQEMPQIERTEVSTNHVLIYFEKVRFSVTLLDLGELLEVLTNQSRFQIVFFTYTGKGREASTQGNEVWTGQQGSVYYMGPPFWPPFICH